MTPQEKVDRLRNVVEKLDISSIEFAVSLMSKYYKSRKLSPKQLEWVDKLYSRALNPPRRSRR